MRTYKTYRGAELNLEAYKGKSSINYEIEVTFDDGSEYDLTIYSSIVCKVFYRKGFTEILSPTVTTSENVVVLNLTVAQTNALQQREYYYEIYGVSVSEQELITFGTFKVS